MNGFLSGVTLFIFILALASIGTFLLYMLVEYGVGFILFVLIFGTVMALMRR